MDFNEIKAAKITAYIVAIFLVAFIAPSLVVGWWWLERAFLVAIAVIAVTAVIVLIWGYVWIALEGGPNHIYRPPTPPKYPHDEDR